MSENPYERFEKTDLILRDELAIDRTILSNERTLLSYVRASLTLVIVGLTFLHFIEKGFLRIAGIIFIPLGILMALYGYYRFMRMKRLIQTARRRPPQVSEATEPGGGRKTGERRNPGEA
jgi:putative membrane protein